ncbi:MAG: COX15/CtaA family protein [Flavobacteriales bacterium]
MQLEKNILRIARLSLACVFMVVIAGSVVRITGSGMGCPDWPFCFGYVIPPVSAEPLTFSEGREFSKGQMIIANDTLWVANSDLVAGATFNQQDWHKYPKHDYAVFNATHTWIEYINRLATGLLGFPCMLLFAISIVHARRKKSWLTFSLSTLTLTGIGFEAWLGKLVVDGNLKENSITWHMLGTLFIIAMLVAIISLHSVAQKRKFNSTLRVAALSMLVLCVAQVVLGTQVREEVDVLAKNIDNRSLWMAQLSNMFIIHRSMSYTILALFAWLFYLNRKHAHGLWEVKWILVLLINEIAVGVILSYFDMPAIAQPMHLLLGVVLFAVAWRLFIRTSFTESNAAG